VGQTDRKWSGVWFAVRGSTIRSKQLATRDKIIYSCLVGGERIGEKESKV
jgi:hypothetical protein